MRCVFLFASSTIIHTDPDEVRGMCYMVQTRRDKPTLGEVSQILACTVSYSYRAEWKKRQGVGGWGGSIIGGVPHQYKF